MNDVDAFRELRKLKGMQLVAWAIGYLVYVVKVVLVTCVSKGNVLSNAVGAFVLVAAVAMDNVQRRQTLVELVKTMEQDVAAIVGWGLAILVTMLWINSNRAIKKMEQLKLNASLQHLAEEQS